MSQHRFVLPGSWEGGIKKANPLDSIRGAVDGDVHTNSSENYCAIGNSKSILFWRSGTVKKNKTDMVLDYDPSINQPILDPQIPKVMTIMEKAHISRQISPWVSSRYWCYVDGMLSHPTSLLVLSCDMQSICGKSSLYINHIIQG